METGLAPGASNSFTKAAVIEITEAASMRFHSMSAATWSRWWAE